MNKTELILYKTQDSDIIEKKCRFGISDTTLKKVKKDE